jgi:Short C-terminal domain
MMRRRMGRPGLVGTMARTAVVAGTATAVVGGVSRHQNARADEAAQQQDMYDQQQAATQSQAEMSNMQSTGSIADELQKLASMRDSGVLSEADFEAAKAKLLS